MGFSAVKIIPMRLAQSKEETVLLAHYENIVRIETQVNGAKADMITCSPTRVSIYVT